MQMMGGTGDSPSTYAPALLSESWIEFLEPGFGLVDVGCWGVNKWMGAVYMSLVLRALCWKPQELHCGKELLQHCLRVGWVRSTCSTTRAMDSMLLSGCF